MRLNVGLVSGGVSEPPYRNVFEEFHHELVEATEHEISLGEMDA